MGRATGSTKTRLVRGWLGFAGAGTAATLVLRQARGTQDAVETDPSAPAWPGPQANGRPLTPPVASPIEGDDVGRHRALLKAIFSDYTALLSLAGLLIYGLVRVAYDAFYTRLGVFPEAVGLSETTILGRAALYLAMTASVGAVFGGLWLLAVSSQLERSRATDGPSAGTPRRLLAGSLFSPWSPVG